MALKFLSAEEITVSATAIGITSTLLVNSAGEDLGVLRADFQHVSGGKMWVLVGTPLTGGGAGEFERVVGDEWRVVGSEDIAGFKMIEQSGEDDGVVSVNLYGA